MKKVVEVTDEVFTDEFECECGNTVTDSGFHPCDAKGEEREPTDGWEGHYVCGQCSQVYKYLFE